MTVTPHPQFPRLFAEGRLGPRATRNRVWMAAHATLLVKDNLFTDAHVHYYVERARGGVGVITMEAMATHPTTQPYKGKAFAFDPRMVPQYRKIADAVHAEGALLMCQPWHRGRETNSVASQEPVWAPSAVPCSVYREMPHVMQLEEIKELIEGYRLSARYAREGGLDGIEVHGTSHGYLLNQFLSPATNHRNDPYGGSFENRLRIVKEILHLTREEAGKDLVVGIRINGDDGHDGGLRPDEWADIARELEATGHLDYVSVTQGTYLNRMLIYPTSPETHGYQMPATAKIKAAVKVPVVGVGRIVEPEEAEGYLASGACDYVALARALIADPQWALKAKRGDARTIRPCVGANWCMTAIFAQAPIACIHNPAAGNELALGPVKKVATSKTVAVVGGGPAGLRAALTLADRGHRVTLYEKEPTLGGQVRLWAKAESRRELVNIVTWLEARVREAGVDIRVNTTVDANKLQSGGYEAVVIATGSRGQRHGHSPMHPARWSGAAVPGTDLPHVHDYQSFLAKEPAGKRAIVYDTLGGRQGAVIAEVLARRGTAVEFVTQLGQGSPDLAASRDWGKVHGMLRRLGATFTVDHEVTAIRSDGVVIMDVYTKATSTRPADLVVLVVGADSNDALFEALAPRRAEGLIVKLIGDAMSPRRVDAAIREGELAAREI
ncbi:MAG: FAD-dependent oxidoreductase [Gammaproteobacteria bacterium]|nr:FAD-dependent oxidoreductase [Gammaproteobacteria bacterium]